MADVVPARVRQLLARLFTVCTLLLVGLVSSFGTLAPQVAQLAHADSALCAVPGNNGPAAINGGIVNTYYPGTTAVVTAGATSFAIGAANGAAPITAGSLLLIIQMQAADINSSNTATYGSGVAGPASGNLANANFLAGQYEYAVATNNVPLAGGVLNLSSSLANSYSNANATATAGQRRFQVVQIPQYSSLTLNGTLTAAPWDGATGGIVAFDVAGGLNFGGATIDVSGQGFRGGGGKVYTTFGGGANNFVVDLATGRDGSKGEGIVGTPQLLNTATASAALGTIADSGIVGYPNGDYGFGAPGNAGGGGADTAGNADYEDNGGGGGGSNGGSGGKGGYGYQGTIQTPIIDQGGYGGAAFSAGAAARVVLGGGGGAGGTNNWPPERGNGANGGGIVMVRAGSISGAGTINANGWTAFSNPFNDAAGGGGAGGSVVVVTQTGPVGPLTINAQGGAGGDSNVAGRASGPHAGGGGGGGGSIYLSGAPTTFAVTGGANGVTSDFTPANLDFGATPGSPGSSATNVRAANLTNSISGAGCLPQLTVTKDTTTPLVLSSAGMSATYRITVSNAVGKAAATAVRLSDTLPAGFTYIAGATAAFTGGATGAAAPANTGSATAPVFGDYAVPGGGSVTVAFTVAIANTVPVGTYQNSASATYSDPTRATATDRATPGGAYATGGATAAGSNYASGSSTAEDVTITALGTVSGVVFNDGNANGSQQAGEGGLGGVTVTLRDSSGTIIATAITAGDGSYTFPGVTPGAYTVVETDLAGYASTTPNNVTVTVPSGGSASANFGDQQQGTVTGHLFIDTNGDGIQQPGEPNLANVTVTITDSNGRTQTVTTDANGNYSATVAPGPVTVQIDTTDPDIPAGSRISTGAGSQTVTVVAGSTATTPNVGFTVAPTAIALTSFSATNRANGVLIQWATSAEVNTFGFTLYRSATSSRSDAVLITPQVILAQGRGNTGAAYSWHDTTAEPGTVYHYWLAEIDAGQQTHEYGPIVSGMQRPQARYSVFIPVAIR